MPSGLESVQPSMDLDISEQDVCNTSVYSSLGVQESQLWDGQNYEELLQDTLAYYELFHQQRLSLIPYCGWVTYGNPKASFSLNSHDFQRRNRVMCSLAALGEYVTHRGGVALNLGGGCGGDSLALAMMKARVITVDGAINAVTLSQEIAEATGMADRIEAFQAETMQFLENAAVNRNRYDVVVCAFSLSGVPDPVYTVSQITELLQPGGYLYVVDSPPTRSFDYQEGRLTLVQKRTIGKYNFRVLKTYFQDDEAYRYITDIMKRAGLQVVYSSGVSIPKQDFYAETIGRISGETTSVARLEDESLFALVEKRRSALGTTLLSLCSQVGRDSINEMMS